MQLRAIHETKDAIAPQSPRLHRTFGQRNTHLVEDAYTNVYLAAVAPCVFLRLKRVVLGVVEPLSLKNQRHQRCRLPQALFAKRPIMNDQVEVLCTVVFVKNGPDNERVSKPPLARWGDVHKRWGTGKLSVRYEGPGKLDARKGEP